VDGECLSIGGRFAIASAHGEDRRISRFIHVDAILAWTKQCECDLRRVDLHGFVIGKPA
jgi:hypothetical protein